MKSFSIKTVKARLSRIFLVVFLSFLSDVCLSQEICDPTTSQDFLRAVNDDNVTDIQVGRDVCIDNSIDIPKEKNLTFLKRSKLILGKDAVLAIGGSFKSDLEQIFYGLGKVVLSTTKMGVIYPEWWGARGDGLQDNYHSISSALSSSPAGATLNLSKGIYLVSGDVGLVVEKPMRIVGGNNSKLLFNSNNAKYIQIRSSGVSIESLEIDGGSPSWIRTDYAALSVNSIGLSKFSNIRIIDVNVHDVAGAGIVVGSSITEVVDCIISRAYVKNTQADGVSVIGLARDVKIFSPRVFNTGDDGVSVVAYLKSAAPTSNVEISDAISVDSKSRGFAIVGGSNVKLSGKVVSSRYQGVLVNQDFAHYRTYKPNNVELDVVVLDAGTDGVAIGRGARDIRGIVSSFGARRRGIVIGNFDDPSENIRLKASAYESATIGVDIQHSKSVHISSLLTVLSGNFGFFLGPGSVDISIERLMAYNNNSLNSPSIGNIFINQARDFMIDTIFSIDDASPSRVAHTLNIDTQFGGSVGSFLGVKGGSISAPRISSSSVNVRFMSIQR